MKLGRSAYYIDAETAADAAPDAIPAALIALANSNGSVGVEARETGMAVSAADVAERVAVTAVRVAPLMTSATPHT